MFGEKDGHFRLKHDRCRERIQNMNVRNHALRRQVQAQGQRSAHHQKSA